MTIDWTAAELAQLDDAQELEIATARADGSLRRWLPIWVVVVDGAVYVRTWRRRETGWFGHAARSGHARVRVPGLAAQDIVVRDVGAGEASVRIGIDDAYRRKYGRGGDAAIADMVTDDAVAATLRLAKE